MRIDWGAFGGASREKFYKFYGNIAVKHLCNYITRRRFISVFSRRSELKYDFQGMSCEVAIPWVNIVKQAGSQPISADASWASYRPRISRGPIALSALWTSAAAGWESNRTSRWSRDWSGSTPAWEITGSVSFSGAGSRTIGIGRVSVSCPSPTRLNSSCGTGRPVPGSSVHASISRKSYQHG